MTSIIPLSSTPATMSSREIAELTGKRHSDVMRDIRVMIDRISASADLRWHCETETYADDGIKGCDGAMFFRKRTLSLASRRADGGPAGKLAKRLT